MMDWDADQEDERMMQATFKMGKHKGAKPCGFLRVAAIALRIGTASSSHKTKSVFGGAMDRMK